MIEGKVAGHGLPGLKGWRATEYCSPDEAAWRNPGEPGHNPGLRCASSGYSTFGGLYDDQGQFYESALSLLPTQTLVYLF